jgi:hypothetical protein
MDAIIHGGGFVPEDSLGTKSQSQGYNIDGVPLFSQFGQPMDQDTPVFDDGEGEGEGYEDGEADGGAWVENAFDGKKKGTSQRTIAYNNKEDLVLFHSWLFISQVPICGSKQKDQVYWRKVTQDLHERRKLAMYWVHSIHSQQSLQNRWA